jgi:hypothetical protein
MRSKTIGETLQETGFNRSNRFNSSNHNQEANDTVGIASKGSNSPTLEGTRMNLTPRTKSDLKKLGFES